MLSGAYASEMVRGMQEGESYPRYLKIGAALKHFTACQCQHALPRGRPLVLPRGLSPLPLECVPPLPPGPPPPASTAHRALSLGTPPPHWLGSRLVAPTPLPPRGVLILASGNRCHQPAAVWL